MFDSRTLIVDNYRLSSACGGVIMCSYQETWRASEIQGNRRNRLSTPHS